MAYAGPDQVVAVGGTVFLSGTGSTDANNDPLSYRWAITSRPARSTAPLSNATTETPSFVADVAGSYVVQLVVNDGKTDSAPDEVVITTSNTTPVANAGSDQTVSPGATVQLNGSASSDLDGDTLTYLWTLTPPPGSSAVLTGVDTATPSFTVDVPGTYTASLMVNDGTVSSTPDMVIISTDNSRPVANAGADQVVAVGDTVTLNGAASSDADNDPLTYLWTLSVPAGSSATLSNPTAVTPTFVPDVVGEYVAHLIVNDGQLNSLQNNATITVGTPPPPSLNYGDLVPGVISEADEVDLYTLSGTAGEVILITLVDTGGELTLGGVAANALLYAPNGVTVGANFNANSQQSFTLPETGTYVIRIVANTLVHTGTYSVGLERLKPAAAVDAVLAPGSLVSASIGAAGETDLYTFDGTANDDILVTLVDTGGELTLGGVAANALLYAPSGVEVGANFNANSQQSFTLPETGTYVIRIVANTLVHTGTYSVGLERLKPAAAVDGILTPGSLVAASIGAAGETDLYTFDGTANDEILVTLVDTGGELTLGGVAANALLYAPSGVEVGANFNANSQQSFTLPETGTYVIRIVANTLVHTGTYSVGLERLKPAAAVDGILTPGSLVAASIGAAGETDLYTFDGTANDEILVTLVDTGGELTLGGVAANALLYAPSGVEVGANFNANSQQSFTLPETGSYVIRIVANTLVHTGTYSVGLERLKPAAAVDGILTPGSLVAASIDSAGETDLYTFDGSANDEILVTLVDTGGQLTLGGVAANALLYAPSGVEVGANFNANSQQSFTLPETGTYVIRIVASTLVHTGTYSVGLEQLNPAAAVDGVLAPGNLASGLIEFAGEEDLYTVSGTAGDVVLITLVDTGGELTLGGVAANALLYAPSGVEVGANFNANSQQSFTLPETGTYVIRIVANTLVHTGTYSVGLERLKPAAAVDAVLEPGSLVSASIGAAGETDLYTFDGTANDDILVTLVDTGGELTVGGVAANALLYAPSGVEVGANFNANSQQSFTLSETGTYVIRIVANTLVHTGTYSVGLERLKPAAAVDGVLTPGSLVAASIDSAGETDLYTFDGSANDEILVTLVDTGGQLTFGGVAANALLYAPSGATVGAGFNADNQQSFTLPETGTYVIRIVANTLVHTGGYNLGLEGP